MLKEVTVKEQAKSLVHLPFDGHIHVNNSLIRLHQTFIECASNDTSALDKLDF